MKLIAILAAAFTTLLITQAARATAPLPAADLTKYQACADDSECVYAQNGSCDCNNGGTGVAINKTKLEEFKKNFEPATCTTVQGAVCGAGIPRCEKNQCIYYYPSFPHPYTAKKKT